MILKIVRVLAKTIIKKFGMLTLEQGLNFLVPFLGLAIPVIEQVLDHYDVILKGVGKANSSRSCPEGLTESV